MNTRLTVPLAQVALHHSKPSPLRLAPPSSRPRSSHALPPPQGPDRSLVAPPEPPQPEPEPELVAGKKKGQRKTFSKQEKASTAAAILSGTERQKDACARLGTTQSVVSRWVQQAKRETAKRAANEKRRTSMLARSGRMPTTQTLVSSGAPSKPSGAAPSAAPTALLEGIEAFLGPMIDRLVGKALARRFGGQ